jgi:hypothetical protein
MLNTDRITTNTAREAVALVKSTPGRFSPRVKTVHSGMPTVKRLARDAYRAVVRVPDRKIRAELLEQLDADLLSRNLRPEQVRDLVRGAIRDLRLEAEALLQHVTGE